ncbi:hypothetical protein ACFY2K_26320 [Kitasatospora sp. NPDC001309]|uniref:hypothetical protein n=1 Tax=Kitasatospora sp. NPDC001309 TaxID=3364013 RepID=UPI0036939A57
MFHVVASNHRLPKGEGTVYLLHYAEKPTRVAAHDAMTAINKGNMFQPGDRGEIELYQGNDLVWRVLVEHRNDKVRVDIISDGFENF